MATDALCLENIDEFVNDENKIVTYKWLSLTLKIHINQAKRLLYTFLQQQKKKDQEVNATYFLAGLSKGDNGHLEHRCLVVAEEDLESTRGQLSTVTSCHIYSIQRPNLKDSNSLYMTDYESVKENLADCNKYSSIHCQRASVPRKQAAVVEAPLPDRNGSISVLQQKTEATKPVNTGSQGSKAKKGAPKGSIASMFAQSSKPKESDSGKTKETTVKEETKENKAAGKKGGVMDFFANAKATGKGKAGEEEKAVVKEKPKEKPAAKDISAQEKKSSKVSQVKSKKSRSKGDLDEDVPQKKRRRIKNDLFDSSSDEEIEIDMESPVPSPAKESPAASPAKAATPEPESPVPTKRTPEKKCQAAQEPQEDTTNSGKRRRRRKLVPKTYLDEDGFMVTEKVWESESTDASEVEEESKKKATPQKKPAPAPTKKNSPQKKASPAKGKQTSLMSFFKKK